MTRRPVLVAVWLGGTAVSVALGWGAVGLVRSNVDLSSSTDGAATALDEVPVATVSSRPADSARPTPPAPAASSPLPTPARTSRPTRSIAPSTARRVTRTFDLQGGTVQARCDGSAVSLGYATPRGGYEVSVHDDGPVELSVRFRSDSHESRLDATCANGVPRGRIREDPR